MSGILIIVAFGVGLAGAVGLWLYVKGGGRGPGKVRPDAPPTSEEKQRDSAPPDTI